MKLGMLRNEAKARPIDSEVREIESLVVEAHKSSGEATFQMCPPILYDAGFLEAIRWLAGDVERLYGLQVKVEDDGQRWPLDEATRILLFRSVNELLTNVAKHAQTDEAVVRMWQQDQLMAVAVEDNGIAFDPSPEASGFGLFSVRERLHHLGGSMKVDSMPGRGTSVVLIAPFSTEGAEARRESA
jgi:signal transduction histidine kinase